MRIFDRFVLELISTNENLTEAEATATHVLLAFHMLFINILLLNLLIAVFAWVVLKNIRVDSSTFSTGIVHFDSAFSFSDSIGKVQENTEFYWRYQRYSFVREYFERVPLSYPPLIFITHVFLVCAMIKTFLFSKVLKRPAEQGQNKKISGFTPTFSKSFHSCEGRWNWFLVSKKWSRDYRS